MKKSEVTRAKANSHRPLDNSEPAERCQWNIIPDCARFGDIPVVPVRGAMVSMGGPERINSVTLASSFYAASMQYQTT